MSERLSMRARLLLGILLPVIGLLAFNAVGLYRQALRAAETAYDRTLLASAKSIGNELEVAGTAEAPQLRAAVPYAAQEAFEADNRSRVYYRVTGFRGEVVSGFPDLPDWHGRIPDRGIYAALVDFYDDVYRGEPVRVAVLLQPVAGPTGQGMATIQVAETMELRHTLARQVLVDTLWRQVALVLVIAAVVLWVVQRATRPVRELSASIEARGADELAPIEAGPLPRELAPLVEATNHALTRVANLVAHQKRFVRDVSHQLRTPLAVLKAQVQSARRGDLPAAQAFAEIERTVDGATRLANQMLALAKLEQLRQQGEPGVVDWAAIVREVALDLAPLVAEKELDFELDAPATLAVRGHEWALRELVRNLMHNAVQHSHPGGTLAMALAAAAGEARLQLADSGPGVSEALRERLFQPFMAGTPGSGSGLGLAICRDVVASHGGRITLANRPEGGLQVEVSLPVADNPAP